MNLQSYLDRKNELLKTAKKFRDLCVACLQPEFSCYCQHIQSFDPKIKFAILIHPIEVRRRIATGRMSHLSLKNSELIMGQNYTQNDEVNRLLASEEYDPVVLYPGRSSLNLTEAPKLERAKIFQPDKMPLVFVIDGTWATAKKMMRESQNLNVLPRICFTPPGPSQFRVRKQPGENCYSTIEAIHHSIELLGDAVGFDSASRRHDRLLYVFNRMVERQLQFIEEAHLNPRKVTYRRVKPRVSA